MRNVERTLSSFEAYCFNCKVTFPSETRRCLHCGERVVSGSRKRAANSVDQLAKQFSEAARRRDQATGSTASARPNSVLTHSVLTRSVLTRKENAIEERLDARLPSSVPSLPPPNEDADEETPTRRFSPLTMIWIALAFAGAAIRDCNGG